MDINNNKVPLFFGLSKGKSLVSKGIRWFQRGVEHTHAMFLPDVTMKQVTADHTFIDDLRVIEADIWDGVVSCPISKNHKEGTLYDIFYVEVTREEAEYYLRWMDSKLGAGYDYLNILGFLTKT